MDQPGKVANPARGQLDRENEHLFPCPCSRLRLVSRDGFGRPVSRQPALSLHSSRIWCLLTRFLPISAAASIYLFLPPTATGPVPSLSGHAIANRWRSLPRVRRHRASGPQGCSGNGCFLFRFHHEPPCMRFSFPTLIIDFTCSGHVKSIA